MNPHTYGCTSQQTGYFDVSRTLLGAKQWATRNGLNKVYVRFNCGYHTAIRAEKINGKWVNK